ncbi:MAG: Lrp/AsnC family transcriptional regulator, partial [Alteromonas macleodii]
MYVDLDAKDRELLDILKRDARTPVTVLAEVLSLSRNTVQKRIDRLVNSGVIDGFTIRVNEQLQPDKIKALMSVELEGLSTTQLISKLRQVNGDKLFARRFFNAATKAPNAVFGVLGLEMSNCIS